MVTGLILALNLPVTFPLWMAAVGSAFAIIVVKQLFGGIGQNVINPAAAARIFLLISFSGQMTLYVTPFRPDAIAEATLLGILKEHPDVVTGNNYLSLFLGNKAVSYTHLDVYKRQEKVYPSLNFYRSVADESI